MFRRKLTIVTIRLTPLLIFGLLLPAGLRAADTVPPVVQETVPVAESTIIRLRQLEVIFSEEVEGVDAADLLINSTPATNVILLAPGQFVFEFSEPAAGSVAFGWGADHGIRDLAGNPFPAGTWKLTLDPNASGKNVLLSEVMSDNSRTINDEDGDSPDWIEIYNSSDLPANLTGWSLTDDPANPAKWRFPQISILPKTYLVVFASEKNRTNPTARLHTNFKLSSSGDFLALLDAQTNIISQFSPLPPMGKDVSYGRDRSDFSQTGYFDKPTPGAGNSISGADFAPPIEFSRTSGTFIAPFVLTLSLPTGSSNVVIRYSTNSVLPTEQSFLYTNPIPVSGTVQIRARTFQPNRLPGPPRTEAFILLSSNVVNFTSNLPLLIIHNFGGGAVPSNRDQFAYMAFFEPGASGRTSLTNPPALSTRAGINIRGSSTEGYAKRSFAVEGWDEFNVDRDLSPLGLPAEADWVLYAPNNFEPVLIHNPFMYQLSRDIGRYAPRTRFVEVYINTTSSVGPVISNNYSGIYVLEEKIKRGPNRVDIDKLEPEHTKPPQVTGGYMFKIDRLDPNDTGFTGAGINVAYVEPKEPEIETVQRDPQEQYVKTYFNQFNLALNSVSFTNPVTGYRQFVDANSWIDHSVLNVLSWNVDALRLSAYFYKPRNGKLTFGPIWDFDRALGSTDGRDENPRVWGDSFFTFNWWSRMFRDADFWQLWIDRWQDLRRNQFSTNYMNGLIDSLVNQVRQAQPRERARWGIAPRGGSYQAEVDRMKAYLKNRAEWIDGQILRPPSIITNDVRIRPGTKLLLSGPLATNVASGVTSVFSAPIYFTLNGVDPRLPGGALSPEAILFQAPITVSGNARLMARTRNVNFRTPAIGNRPPNSSPWSGLVSATFNLSPPALAITEIMYHPAAPAAGSIYLADDFEFIELKNTGTNNISLAGIRFRSGIEFDFTGSAITNLAPGAYVLVVKNRAAFSSRYGNLSNIAGEFLGNLDNKGERLVLDGPLGEVVLEFAYDPGWYRVTDGLGFSLVPVSESAPSSAFSQSAGWRPSATPRGSPGGVDATPAPAPPVLVNEVLTHSGPPLVDAVELFNPASAPANIGGWFISDDFSTPEKFRVPVGTSIPAGDYVTFDESQLNAGSNGFSFGANGDEVYLFSANPNGELTGYVHGFGFGAAEFGVSFGRHVISTGEERFVAQIAPTFNQVNSGPMVGPVVINEIIYRSVLNTNIDFGDEYVELRNISSSSVRLFDPQAPTNTWRLRGGADFDFSTNRVLAAGSYCLLVNFDPENAAQLGQFTARNGIPPTVPVFGPIKGKLNNAGDRITLTKPIPADAPGGGSAYVTVDEVNYQNRWPWPAEADGTGLSLQRVTSARYGDDPINWTAASPTPGTLNANPQIDADGDQLPDAWELAHGLDPRSGAGFDGVLGDPDGDGQTNLQEYLAGTDPRDFRSYLGITSVSLNGASVLLRFAGAGGKTYAIQFRDNAIAGEWSILARIAKLSGSGIVEIADTNAAPATARFYRVVTP